MNCRPNDKNEEYNYELENDEKNDGFQNDNTNAAYDYEDNEEADNPDNAVQPTPIITTIPKDVIAKANQTVHLTCEVEHGGKNLNLDCSLQGLPFFLLFRTVSHVVEEK